MKRTVLAAIAATAVLLAGCGSNSGTPTAGPNTPAQSQTTTQTTSDQTTPEQTTSDQSTPESTESTETTPEVTNTDGGIATPTPTKTVGDGSGALDATSARWFDTFCTGLGPITGLAGMESKLDPSDLKGTMKVLATTMSTLGDSFTKTADSLKGLPAPTFSGGSEFASKVVTALGETGPKFSEAGAKIAKADPTDPSALQDAVGGLSNNMSSAMQPLQDLENLKVTQATQDAIMEIPSCKKLNTMG